MAIEVATFSRATFNAEGYSTGRPTYPAEVYEAVLQYYERARPEGSGARYECAVDLGCGTGG